MAKILLLFFALLLGACSKPEIVEIEKISTVYVPVPAPCPEKTELDRLIRLRPAPLKGTAMPATAIERIALQTAQLGKFEADGGWADQVISALQRCRNP